MPEIKINGFDIKRVGADISAEDSKYFKGLIKNNDFQKLLEGEDNNGNSFRASVNVKFDEGNFIMRNTTIKSTVKGYDPSNIQTGLELANISI